MLTPKQLDLLRWLAVGGRSPQQICEQLRITLACFYVHCQNIRKRTGIKDVRNARECDAWLRGHPEARRRANLPTVPTRRQYEILVAFAAGKDYDQIAAQMNLSRQTVMCQMSAARMRAGITGPAYGDRKKQVQEYLARSAEVVTMNDPAFR